MYYQISELVQFSGILLCFIAFQRKKYQLNKLFLTIYLYVALCLVLQIVQFVLAYTIHNNLPVFHLQTLLEFILLSVFFHQFFEKKKIKRSIEIIAVLFTLFAIANALFLEPPFKVFNSNTRAVSSLILTVYCLAYYYAQISHPKLVSLHKDATFWLVTGIFFYYTGTAIIGSIWSFLNQSQSELFRITWEVQNLFNLIKYALFAFSLRYIPIR
jgi:hypothetical protein